MATWLDVERVIAPLGGVRLSETMCQVTLPGIEPNREQKVYLSLDLMPPDFMFLRVISPIAMIGTVDLGALIRRVGQLQIGCLSYQPAFDQGQLIDGFVNLASSTPLGTLLIDENSIMLFRIYLSMFARAADMLEKELSEPSMPDLF